MTQLSEMPEYWFTPFQIRCLHEILQLVENRGVGKLKLAPRRAQSEAVHDHDRPVYYFIVWIEDSQIELWIYEKEAMYFKDNLTKQFERVDYDNDKDLIKAVVIGLLEDF